MNAAAPVAWALIVDDSSAVRMWVRRALELAGVPADGILTASDGASAIGRLRRERPPLVFLDVNMPIQDGLETLSQIKKDPKLRGAKVVILTSDGSDVRAAVARGLGALVLRKPVAPEAIVEVARSTFGDRLVPSSDPAAADF